MTDSMILICGRRIEAVRYFYLYIFIFITLFHYTLVNSISLSFYCPPVDLYLFIILPGKLEELLSVQEATVVSVNRSEGRCCFVHLHVFPDQLDQHARLGRQMHLILRFIWILASDICPTQPTFTNTETAMLSIPVFPGPLGGTF